MNALSLLLVLACDPDAGRGPVDVDLDAGGDADCVGEADVTWASWGDGFFRTWCQGCHSVDAANRSGAPVGMDFDTEAQVTNLASTVRRVVLDERSMPLGGGISEADAVLLDTYLRCGLVDEPGDDPGQLESDPPGAAPTAAEAASAMQTALSLGLGGSVAARGTMEALLRAGGEGCVPDHGVTWLAPTTGCLSSEGYVFSGLAEYVGDPEELADTTSFLLLADAWIVDAEGQRFWSGGEAELDRTGTTDEGQAWSRLAGSWGYEGQAGWWDEGFTGVLVADVQWEGDAWSVLLEGSQGTGGGDLYFEQVQADARDCPQGAAGTVWLRADDGGWSRLELSGDCGCGPVFFGEQSLGEACVDLSAAAGALVEELRP